MIWWKHKPSWESLLLRMSVIGHFGQIKIETSLNGLESSTLLDLRYLSDCISYLYPTYLILYSHGSLFYHSRMSGTLLQHSFCICHSLCMEPLPYIIYTLPTLSNTTFSVKTTSIKIFTPNPEFPYHPSSLIFPHRVITV